MGSPDLIPLQYAVRPAKGARWAPRIAVLIALIVVAIFAKRDGPMWVRRVRVLYWQHECLVYAPNLDQPVLRLSAGSPVGTPVVANCFQTFAGLLSQPGYWGSKGAVFLHGVQTSDGIPCLVEIGLSQGTVSPSKAAVWFCGTTVIELGDIWREPRFAWGPYCDTVYDILPLSANATVMPATIDPKNPAHVQFKVLGSRPLQVDTWLSISDGVKMQYTDVNGISHSADLDAAR